MLFLKLDLKSCSLEKNQNFVLSLLGSEFKKLEQFLEL